MSSPRDQHTNDGIESVIPTNSISTGVASMSSAVHHHHHHYHHHHYERDSGTGADEHVENRGSNVNIPNLSSVPNTTSNANTDINSITNNGFNIPLNRSKHEGIPFLKVYSSVKTLSLNHLTAKQHLLMATCRDFSLILPIIYSFSTLRKAYEVLSANKKSIHLYDIQSITETLALLWQTYMLNKNNLNSTNSDSHLASSTSSSSSSSDKSTQLPDLNAKSFLNKNNDISSLMNSLIKPNSSEYVLCALWCLVSLYLTYSILDSLMVRWIVKYSTVAAIMRMFSMSILILTTELLLLSSFSPQSEYYLHTWILISCILTALYIWQSYLTSNLNYVSNDEDGEFDNHSNGNQTVKNFQVQSEENSLSSESDTTSSRQNRKKKKNKKDFKPFRFTKKRTIDLYNITVFCVVPVGMASFITMVGLLRNLFIQRLDVEQISMMLTGTFNT